MSQKNRNKLSILFYRNTNPYHLDDKGNIIKEKKSINNQIVEVGLPDKSKWTNNIKVCFIVDDPSQDVVVPQSLSQDFIQSMVSEKKEVEQPLQFTPKTDYSLDPNSVRPTTIGKGTDDEQSVIYTVYKPNRSKFISNLSISL